MDKISSWKKFIGTPSFETFQKSVKHISSHEYDGVIYEYYLQANGLDGDDKTTFQDVAIVVLLAGANLVPGLYSWLNIVGLVLLALATLLTIVSGTECIVKNRAVLKDNK